MDNLALVGSPTENDYDKSKFLYYCSSLSLSLSLFLIFANKRI